MKIFLVVIMALLITDPKEIAKINALKKEAEEAYLAQDYRRALAKYTILHDSLGIDDAAIKLNLAHAYYHLGDTANARINYENLTSTSTENNKLRSIAHQQLGVIGKDAKKLKEALKQLKSAIKADPSNREAIYNYEVVKKLLEKQQEQQQQNKDQQNKDGEDEQDQQNKDGEDEDKENKDGEGEQDQQNKDGEDENKENKDGEEQQKSEEEKKQEQKEGEEEDHKKSQDEMTEEKLKEMGISKEKAKQLLEAMRQSEIKYLQYQKRKPTKRPPSGKPDW